MRVAITGATGFLGGRLARRLHAEGHEVVAMGRNARAGAALRDAGIGFVDIDLAMPGRLPEIGPIDAMVHAAALSSNWGRRADFQRANVSGTDTALQLARRGGATRFVFISSPSVGFRFADQLGVTEDMPLPPPVNAYAASKAEAERRVLGAADLSPIVLRPRGLYGRGDTALLPRLVRAARRGPLPLLRDGKAVTDLTHVDDVVTAIGSALAADEGAAGQVINVSGGEPLSIRHIVEAACRHADVGVRWRSVPVGMALASARAAEAICAVLPGRPEPVATAYSIGVLAFSQTLDLGRARELLGWRPTIGFDAGLGRP